MKTPSQFPKKSKKTATSDLIDLTEENCENKKDVSPSPSIILNQQAESVYVRVDGQPVPFQQRRLGRNGRYYNPLAKEKKEVVEIIRLQLRKQPLKGAVSVSYHFYFRRPGPNGKAMFTRKNKLVSIKVDDQNYPSCKPYPDEDNLKKFINDAMSTAVFDDDVQDCRSLACKDYTDGEPYTAILVYALKPPAIKTPVVFVDDE